MLPTNRLVFARHVYPEGRGAGRSYALMRCGVEETSEAGVENLSRFELGPIVPESLDSETVAAAGWEWNRPTGSTPLRSRGPSAELVRPIHAAAVRRHLIDHLDPTRRRQLRHALDISPPNPRRTQAIKARARDIRTCRRACAAALPGGVTLHQQRTGSLAGERIEGTTKSGRSRVGSIDADTVQVLKDHRKR